MTVSTTDMTGKAATTSTATTSSTSSALADAQAQKDQFLKILMTQLQNQNPLDPQKPEEFATQLAQFSQLEQQIDSNSKLDALTAQLGKTSVSPIAYLGTQVDYNSAVAPVQNSQAQWSYSTDGSASTVKLSITDAAGNVYYSGNGDISAGSHTLQLTGLDGVAAGTPLTLTVSAATAANVAVPATIAARATIDAVSSNNGTTTLEAGGYAIDSALVTRIATPTSTASTSNTSSNS